MRQAVLIGLGLASVLAMTGLAQGEPVAPVHHYLHHHVHHVYHHAYTTPTAFAPSATAQVAPLRLDYGPPAFPFVAPYPNGAGDEDGLSRNVDDCNKGCIGGNPD